MIHEVTMYAATCDNCGEDWEDSHYGWVAINERSAIEEDIKDADWHIADDDNCYCDKCHSFNDEDKLIINSERTKN